MRNGIDISGFSEIIEEVTNNPVEAQFKYAAEARWTATGGTCATVKPAQIGSLRAPRIYEVPVEPSPSSQNMHSFPAARPDELALVALSGCFLVSVVSGLSAQRCTIEQLEMDVGLDIEENLSRPVLANYRIGSKIDKSREKTLEIIESVKSMSPNYRTFVEKLPITCAYSGTSHTFDAIDSQIPAANEFSSSMELQCRWQYGTQLAAVFSEGTDTERQFPIDQPKQLGGIDWAPNPQEYLLMALASDILNGIIASEHFGKGFANLIVTANARVDIRGMCNVADVPVHLQDINLKISSQSIKLNGFKDFDAVLSSVIENSKVCYLIRQSVKVHSMVLN